VQYDTLCVIRNVKCYTKLKSVVLLSILWYLFLILHFFIKLFYILLKFQDVSSVKSKIPTILNVLLITVNI
jgi:hypothetical protein